MWFAVGQCLQRAQHKGNAPQASTVSRSGKKRCTTIGCPACSLVRGAGGEGEAGARHCQAMPAPRRSRTHRAVCGVCGATRGAGEDLRAREHRRSPSLGSQLRSAASTVRQAVKVGWCQRPWPAGAPPASWNSLQAKSICSRIRSARALWQPKCEAMRGKNWKT